MIGNGTMLEGYGLQPLELGAMTIDEEDQLAIDQIRQAGGNLAKPTEIVFHLYFQAEAQALPVSVELRNLGYNVSVDVIEAVSESEQTFWAVIATRHELLTIEFIRDASVELNRIAAAANGSFDGWEAAVTQ
jgi:hypothetical protein